MADIELNTGSAPAEIRYTVRENAAASKLKGEQVYTARVVADTASLNTVAEQMVARGCPFAKSYIVAVLTDMANVVGDLLRAGLAVNLGGLVTLRPTIKGTFAGEDAAFSPETNRLGVTASVGAKLRNITAGSSPQKTTPVQIPAIAKVYNGLTGEENTLCSASLFIVNGKRLAWDDAQEDEGFFLNLLGVQTKCTVVKGDYKGEQLILHTSQVMEVDDRPELWFYTRINNALYQVRYDGDLVCVAKPTA